LLASLPPLTTWPCFTLVPRLFPAFFASFPLCFISPLADLFAFDCPLKACAGITPKIMDDITKKLTVAILFFMRSHRFSLDSVSATQLSLAILITLVSLVERNLGFCIARVVLVQRPANDLLETLPLILCPKNSPLQPVGVLIGVERKCCTR